MLIVGERINSSRAKIARAIEEKDVSFIQKEATIQVEAGAAYIDVNAGSLVEKEDEHLEWLVETVQQATTKPLCIDTVNPSALAAALKLCQKEAMVNSITGQKERYEAFLPLIKEYNCSVVTLCMDDSGAPHTIEGKVSVASRIIDDLTAKGVNLDSIYIDPLVYPIGVDFNSAVVVLDTIEQIRKKYPGVRTICGASNISFGLPLRKQINRIFTVMALLKGLDAAIIDPCDRQLMANIIIANTLLGKDEYCMNYINAYREGKLEGE